MGYCARVFDQAGLTLSDLSSYRMVIWDDFGAEGLMDSTVQVLAQVFASEIPLYLIGDRLVTAPNRLSVPNRATWSNLLHLTSLERSDSPGPS